MPVGRPRKYEKEEDLTLQIEAYFKHCEELPEIPNKAGLCLSLGISRDTYNEYKKRFPDAIKGAEAVIENAWVQRLNSTAPTGAIFYLKNAFKEDYRDRHETDITTKGDKVTGFNYIPPYASPDSPGA